MQRALFALALLVFVTDAAQGDEDLGAAAWRVLETHCAACHDGSRAPAKGAFDHVLDLDRLGRDGRYVLPGAPQHSPLLQQVTERRMPPPTAGARAPTAAEIEVLRAWILAGARRGAAPAPPLLLPTGNGGAVRLLGGLHPLTVHFPIVLLIGAALLEVLLAVRPLPILERAGRIVLALGALSALAASATGWSWAASSGHAADAHRWLAVGMTLCASGTLLLAPRPSADAPTGTGRRRTLYRTALGLTLALVVLTGHHGGLLTHGRGRLGL